MERKKKAADRQEKYVIQNEAVSRQNEKSVRVRKGVSISIAGVSVALILEIILFVVKQVMPDNLLLEKVDLVVTFLCIVGIVVYVTFFFLAQYLPKVSWKCPKCGKSLPYYVPLLVGEQIAGPRALKTIKERKIRSFRMEMSNLIIPEKCPYCEELFCVRDYPQRENREKKAQTTGN